MKPLQLPAIQHIKAREELVGFSARFAEGLQPRLESGPVQFGTDWPGVFLRGDDAAQMAWLLKCLLLDVRANRTPAPLRIDEIEDFITLFESADVRKHE